MSMVRSLFRPGKGQKVSRYIQAFINGAAAYHGDFVVWDTTAPTTQGTSGVVDGKTLGTNDYVYVVQSTAIATGTNRGAGLIEGRTIGDRNTTTALTDDQLVIVQTYGVFDDNCFLSASSTTRGDILFASSTVAGQLIVSAAVTATDSTNDRNNEWMVGFTLGPTATYTRAAVTNANGATVFIRCDF